VEGTFAAVVVGAGQAGLAISRELDRRDIEHVVLERGEVGNTWRTQRWDSFRLNTPNRMTVLPDLEFGGDPDAFAGPGDLVEFFERYAREFALPVRTGVTVTSVEATDGGFIVATDDPAAAAIPTRAVVIASGPQQRARVPGIASRLEGVTHLTAGEYRSAGLLPPGAVLVVGSAQSGCQIAEDLVEAGRRVFLAVSSVGRSPRTYRGRDITSWLGAMGFMDMREEDLPDPAMAHAPWPQVSGVGRRGRSVSLQWLASLGATLVGHLADVSDGILRFDDSVADAVRFADGFSATLKQQIDGFVAANGLDVADPEPDPGDVACEDPESLRGPIELHVDEIGSVVWCTGFDADLSWIHLPIVDERGHPLHRAGVSPVPGIFYMGLPWMLRRRSAIISGVADDAVHVADAVAAHLGQG
jgi:putative flavoprotein involved in K+ transport